LTPEAIDAMSDDHLSQAIYPSGFYKQKTSKIRNFNKWYGRFNYDLSRVKSVAYETLRPSLLEIKGIGKETADCILTYAFEKESFVIDAYTKRLFGRLGLNTDVTYDALKRRFENVLPVDLAVYRDYHGLIVEHSKEVCKNKPNCEVCPLNSQGICEKNI